MNDFEAGAEMARRILGRDSGPPTKAVRKAEARAERAEIRAGVEADVDRWMEEGRARQEREDGQRMAARNLASRRAAQLVGEPMQRRAGSVR